MKRQLLPRSQLSNRKQDHLLKSFLITASEENGSSTRANMKVTIIDTEPAVRALIDSLEHLPTQPPSLYLDIEGVKLSRHGSISIIQLFIWPKDHVFLLDVFILKAAVFCISNQSGTTLRSILESALVPKVFFDVRNDSDALFSHFQISLAGIHDVQLLEVATRSSSKDILTGLARCIEKDAQLMPEALAVWKATKHNGLLYFSPEHGGSYEVFHFRPMLQAIVDYCTQDVVYLPILWRMYTQKVSAKWMRKVQDKTCERILASQKASYEPHGRHKIFSPWANPAKAKQQERPGNIGVRSPKGMTKTVVAQETATKAGGKTTTTQPNAKAQSQQSAAQENPRRSARLAALEAAKNIPKLPAEREPAPPKLNLPVRSKNQREGTSQERTDPTSQAATVGSKWKCTTCSREMQQNQKEDHLAGKPHIARAQQTAALQTGTSTVKQKTLTLPTTTITAKPPSPQIGRSPAKAKPPQTRRHQKPQATGTTNGKKSQATGPQYQQLGLPYPPDHLFVGFQGSVFPRHLGAGTSFSYDSLGYDQDYSVCDKDCGWCGHCMDGVFV